MQLNSKFTSYDSFNNDFSLNSLIETTKDRIWCIDKDYKLILANSVFINHVEKFTGKIIEIGDNIFVDGLNNEISKKWKAYYDTAINGERFKHEVKTTVLEKQLYIEYQFNPLRNSNGDIVGVSIFGHDITERKELENKLLIIEERLNDAQKLSQIGSFYYDAIEDKSWWSDQLFRIYGIEPQEKPLSRSEIAVYTHPEDKNVGDEFISKALNTGKPVDVDYKIIAPDGTVRYHNAITRVKADENGKLLEVSGTIQDVTDKKLTEKTIKESEQRFRSLLNDISSVSVQGYSKDGIVNYWNKASEILYGYSQEEAIGNSIFDLIIPATIKSEIQSDINFLLESKETLQAKEIVLKRKNDESITVFSSKVIVQIPGKPIEIFCIDIDLTKQKKYQESLLQNELKLKKVLAEKDKFFAIIAHDLRTPFLGFLSLAQTLAEDYKELSLDELKHYGSSIMKSANQLYKLLENLLLWSKIQRNETEFFPDFCVLKSMVNQNIELLRQNISQKKLTVNNLIPDHIQLSADQQMLNTILRNLFSNAIKFTNEGGIIEIGVEKSKNIDQQIPYNHCIIYVKDNGIGMSQNLINNLFRIDEKVTRPGTDGESSSGLGLVLCMEFVKLHNGRLWVKSEEGKGSTFYFTIPYKK